MDRGSEEYRVAFNRWLRTGLFVLPEPPEAKYNHWHDVRDGRFTQAGAGRHDGTPARPLSGIRPGGGSFGGGGASGYTPLPIRPGGSRGYGGGGSSNYGNDGTDWGHGRNPAPRPSPRAHQTSTASPNVATTVRKSPAHPFKVVRRNGYEFQIDNANRTRRIAGNLSSGFQPRSRRIQAQAGIPNRLPSDDGGHYIAPRFNGPAETFNHFAQDANFNRGRYRAIEDEWAKGKRQGEKVTVRLVPVFEGTSQRPATINIYWTIGSRLHSQKIPNARRGTQNVGR